MADKKKIVVICGPTASGKTGLSLSLAEKFPSEIISADSMQVYEGLNVGTAKATADEQRQVRHHLIDILPPSRPYNVQMFVQLAARAIEDIRSRGKLPLIVGGTGLYIESLVSGIKFSDQPDNSGVKEKLRLILKEKGKEYLYSRLVDIDPDYARTVHPNNTVRVMRAIEIYMLTGHNMTYQIANSKPADSPYESLLIGVNYKDRQSLYKKINERVDAMIKDGILAEARYVYDNRSRFRTCVSAIGYKEFFPYFDGEKTLEECANDLKQASRNYAKRQLTWFNRMKNIHWLFADSDDCAAEAARLTQQFLKG